MLTRLAKHTHRRRARRARSRIASWAAWEPTAPSIGRAGAVSPAWPHRGGPSDPVASLHRDQRRRDHNAVMSKTRKLPVKTIAARPRLIAETQPPSLPGKPLRQLGDLIGAVRKCPEAAHLPAAQSFRDGHRYRRLMHIQTHEYGSVHLAHPPCLRLGAANPAQRSIGACRGMGHLLLRRRT